MRGSRRVGDPDAAGVHALLREAGATLATAESLTGGRLGAVVTSVPGASATYVGGVVAYATAVKTDVLGVPEDLVAEHGVVSAPCAVAMARGVQALTGATYALATTGVAGPEEQEDQPAGTVFVGLAGPGGTEVLALELGGDRAEIVERTCAEALRALARLLDTAPSHTP